MTYSPREPWSKIPNEDSEPHVQLILRWVFIRKGVGAFGHRLACGLVFMHAGLIRYFLL